MKIPLRYQMTEFDCGQTSLMNAISYLFSCDEIPAEILKNINSYTMDLNDSDGNIGQGGTSRKAIEKFASWLNYYSKRGKIKIKAVVLMKNKVTLKKIQECLKNNGVCLIRCYQSVEHYVVITKIKGKQVYIFDPYYIKRKNYKDKEFKIILNKPFKYNRKVSLKRVFSESKDDFSLGIIAFRQCVLFTRKSS